MMDPTRTVELEYVRVDGQELTVILVMEPPDLGTGMVEWGVVSLSAWDEGNHAVDLSMQETEDVIAQAVTRCKERPE